jgi:hypothetical protein
MKGPYERRKYDLRRLWECPVCKRRERTPGSVTFCHCSCQMAKVDGRPVVMKLVEDGAQRIAPPVVIGHEQPLPPALEGPSGEVAAASVNEPPPAEPPETIS